ncbi:MAG: UDP-glucose dehydrogenase family protein [Bryobacteraceae bacterium]
MKVTIVGAGYVGLVTGGALAYLGNDVTYLDNDEQKIAALRDGQPSIYEPGLAELLELGRDHLHSTTKYEEAIPNADVVFITVGTPLDADGCPNLTYVEAAAHQIGLNLGSGFTLIVNKSTVPIGSGNWVEAIVRDAFELRNGHKPDSAFSVASNPEFLKEGTALQDTFYPDRIVIGSKDPKAIAVLSDLYRPLLNQDYIPPSFLPRPEGLGAVPVITADLASAELIKYAANAFLTVKISFINEMASLAQKVGADVLQLSRGIGLDARIGSRFLQAGIGWGGSCFGKDTAALIGTGQEYGIRMPIVEAAREVNCRQREWAIEKLLEELKILKGCTIGVLGVAFKPNTDDLRDAPALDISKRLVGRGAKVLAHDPVALERARREASMPGIIFKNSPEAVFESADAVLLATEWEDYRSLPFAKLLPRMASPVFIDGRNFLNREQMQSAGYRYVGVGR